MLSAQKTSWPIMAGALLTMSLWWAQTATAQIGCDPASSRGDAPGPKSSACGVGNKHRMGSAEPRRYHGEPSYYSRGRYSATESSTPMSKAADILPYLPPRCAELNEAIRTASVRGVRYELQSQLRDDYQQKCSDEEEEARRQLSAQRKASREAVAQVRQTEQAQKQLSEQEQFRCNELRRILMGKRQRLQEMSEGEKGDLQRSEAAFNERCRR